MFLDFFPSPVLARYMARMFLIRVASVVALLVTILISLDLLGESGKILAYPGNGDAELWTYVGWRAPQIIEFVLPFSVLLGTLITLASLNQNSEVIAMKAGGLSAHQILAPLVVAALGVAGVSFAFNELIVAPGTAKLTQWEKVEFGPIPRESNVRTNVWVRDGDNLINAATVRGRGAAVQIADVTIYQRQNNGLSSIVKAKGAVYRGGDWQLNDVTLFNSATGEESRQASMIVGANLRPDQFTLANVDADGMPMWELDDAITDLRTAGRPTGKLEAAYWHKISGPLSAILMPLLGAVAAFGLARSGQLFVRAVIGMALGFAYFVADNFALAMGNLGAYPPLLAAWSPFVLFALIGETVLIRTEE